MERVNYGFQGIITDTVSGEPLKAMVYIADHDIDSSWVWSKLPSGFYSRPIFEGNYNVTFSSLGYFSKTIYNVNVTNLTTTYLNVQLRPVTYGVIPKISKAAMVFPNPNNGTFQVFLPETRDDQIKAVVYNIFGEVVITNNFNLSQGSSNIVIEMEGQSAGLYFLQIDIGKNTYTDKILLR